MKAGERDPETGAFRVNDRRWWAEQPEQPERPEHPGNPGEAAESAEDAQQRAPEQPEAKPKYVEYLEQQLQERDRKLESIHDRQRRALAELERSKERIEREAQRQLELSRRELIRDLLDLIDDLERALEAARGETQQSPLYAGVELVSRRFLGKLAELGVTRHDPTGESFDPNTMDAASVVPVTDPTQHNVVVGLIKTGYKIGDEVLRPALVAVGKAAA